MIPKLNWKQWVRIVLAVVFVADAGLSIWNWQSRDANSQSQLEQRDRLRQQHAALGDDVRLAAEIRSRLPEVEKQCDQFLKDKLPPVSNGYSSIVEDMNRISSVSGLTTKGMQYRQKELEGRAVTEVQVTATVEGSYASLVKFINEIEKSKEFYLLDELALVEASSKDTIRLSLQLKTYFRLKV